MRRQLIAVLAAWCVAGHAVAAALPKELIGIWATDNSVLQGQVLVEGEALYLGPDGVGAVVGGRPAVGVRVVASFEPTTGTISFDILQHEKVVGHGAAVYDAGNSSVSFGDPAHPLFHRRFDEVAPDTLKALTPRPRDGTVTPTR